MTELGITILVTIHQPRREMWNNCFDNVLLMCQGRPAFYGPPQKSIAFFKTTFKTRVEIMQMMSVSQNPADVIIDILSNPSLSVFVLSAYALSDE
jgi:ABC-type multidrug transport system ATPase subunit